MKQMHAVAEDDDWLRAAVNTKAVIEQVWRSTQTDHDCVHILGYNQVNLEVLLKQT
jgi:hypothetical protein